MEPQPNTDPGSEVVSVKEWMITLLITFIPIVNIVMYFIWAFGKNTNYSKANWAKAILLWFAIGILFWLAFLLFLLPFS
ncbi:MAG: hypothetical protein WEB89_04905 [Balneolales bacterium]